MFKFFLYISLCVSLIYLSFANNLQNPSLEILGSGEYCIYSREDVSSPLIQKRIDSGLGYIYYCESNDASALRFLFSKIDGESITVQNLSPNKVFKILNQKQVSSSDGVYYGFSGKSKTYIKNGLQRISLQISIRDKTTTVGWPVILGSF